MANASRGGVSGAWRFQDRRAESAATSASAYFGSKSPNRNVTRMSKSEPMKGS